MWSFPRHASVLSSIRVLIVAPPFSLPRTKLLCFLPKRLSVLNVKTSASLNNKKKKELGIYRGKERRT